MTRIRITLALLLAALVAALTVSIPTQFANKNFTMRVCSHKA